uniref:Saposin B-type domain-containing protein n=1 Tax=Strongyloides papillosus TaxID=174720 RepID=A0A0N5CA91_STREA
MKYLIILLFTFNYLLAFDRSETCDPCISSFDTIKQANNVGKVTVDQLKELCVNIGKGSFVFKFICEKTMLLHIDFITQEIKEFKDSKEICRKITFCD